MHCCRNILFTRHVLDCRCVSLVKLTFPWALSHWVLVYRSYDWERVCLLFVKAFCPISCLCSTFCCCFDMNRMSLWCSLVFCMESLLLVVLAVGMAWLDIKLKRFLNHSLTSFQNFIPWLNVFLVFLWWSHPCVCVVQFF